jgi:hypothetical protein
VNPTHTVACISLKPAWQAVSLRSALTALLLVPLAAASSRHWKTPSRKVPTIGKIRAGAFQPLEAFGATASNDWN